MEILVQDWNETIPDFQISVDELQKPKPMFFMEAILKLFEALDIQIEPLLKHKPQTSNTENYEAFADILPLLNLTAAVNQLILEIFPDSDMITMADLITPTKSIVERVLKLLLNFILFVLERKACINQGEEEIKEQSQKFTQMILEKDRYKIEMDSYLLENIKIEQQIKKMTSELIKDKEQNSNYEKELNELKNEYEFNKNEREAIISDLEKHRCAQARLLEDFTKLKSQIVTEAEQTDVMARKEAIVKKESEYQHEIDEIRNMLWQKETSITTLENNITCLTECGNELDTLNDLYQKIRALKTLNKSTHDEEKQLADYQKKASHLEEKIAELQKVDNELSEELEKLNVEVENTLPDLTRKEETLVEEYEKCKNSSNEYKNKINELQAATNQYFVEYKQCMNKYTQEIPSYYDNMVDDFQLRVEKILDNLACNSNF